MAMFGGPGTKIKISSKCQAFFVMPSKARNKRMGQFLLLFLLLSTIATCNSTSRGIITDSVNGDIQWSRSSGKRERKQTIVTRSLHGSNPGQLYDREKCGNDYSQEVCCSQAKMFHLEKTSLD